MLIYLAYGLTAPMFAQGKNVINENQQWLQYIAEIKMNHGWIVISDAGYRWKDGFSEPSQYIVRSGIGYALNTNLRVLVGFAHLGFYSENSLNKLEFRPYQELTFKTAFNKVNARQRFRIEERFFSPVNGNVPSNTFNFRFQYSVLVSIPLFKLSENNPDSKFILSLGDELFINAGKDIVNNIFDQNRIIISPTFQINKHIAIAPTWFSQFASTKTQGNYKHTDVLLLQIKHNIDWSTK